MTPCVRDRLLQRGPLPLALVTVSLLVAGCAAPPATETPSLTPAPAYAIDPTRTPHENLAALAAQEAAASRPIPAGAVALPPGVDPAALSLRARTDTAAFASLGEAVAVFVKAHSLDDLLKDVPRPPASAPDDEPATTAGLRHYIKGREAALADRHLVAANELQRALDLDPSSISVRRELARSLHALGNFTRAADLYASILTVEPTNMEARFSLGLIAASRREHEAAVMLLGAPFLREWAAKHGGSGFTHDLAANVLAAFTLSASLRELGYDRASIEAAAATVGVDPELLGYTSYQARLTSVLRQQSETWRSIGDAHCRLGEYRQAMEAYAAAASYPSADPAAIHPRVIYAQLQLGKAFGAQLALLNALESSAPRVSDRDIRLCSYVADHAADREVLIEAVLAMHRAAADQAELARAAAALLPADRAVPLLREFVARNPRDLHAVSQLLSWVGQRDLRLAVELAIALIADHPDLAADYAGRLVFSVNSPGRLLSVIRSTAPSPSRAVLEARVLAIMGGQGEAWRVIDDAGRRWPDDRSLAWMRIEMAAILEEPGLLADAVQRASVFDDTITWATRAKAHRMLNQVERAVEAAETAADLALRGSNREHSIRAMLELAFAYAAYAAAQEQVASRRQWASEAVDAASQVMDMDPMREAAYELLLTLHGPGGILSDQQSFRAVAQRLYESDSESRLYARMAAEEAIAQGRHAQALDRLLNLYDSDPNDSRALALAVNAWVRGDRVDAALQWIGERLQIRPGDPALREQWITLMVMQNRGEEAIHSLRTAMQQDADDVAAVRLLESAYRAMGRMDEAFPLGERRLLARPVAVRREVELAALYAGVRNEDRAATHLRWVADHATDASFEHLITAVAVLGRMEKESADLDRITVTLVQEVTQRRPAPAGGVPLQIYALGILSMARLNEWGDAMDALAQRAAAEGRNATGASIEASVVWRDLAQALVNAGQPRAAARTLRARLSAAAPLEQDAINFIVTITLATDAAWGDEAAEDTIRLIDGLAARGRLPQLFGMDGPATREATLFQASQVYSLLGRTRGSERILREVVASDPTNAMAKNNLSYALIDAGRDDPEAAQWAERALELAPDEASILDTVGWLRYRQGRFEDQEHQEGALTLIRRAIEKNEGEPSAEVLDHLGDVLWRTGDADGAVSAWRQAAASLAAPEHRQQVVRNYELLQARGWGLVVQDPQAMYDRDFGKSLEQIQRKLNAVERGEPPDVAATFEELRSGG